MENIEAVDVVQPINADTAPNGDIALEVLECLTQTEADIGAEGLTEIPVTQ